MTSTNNRKTDSLQRLTTFMYLTPIVGVLPSLWTLLRRQTNDRRELAVCRQSLWLAFLWFAAYITLSVSADVPELPTTAAIRLLFFNSLITSGYFIVSLWLMARLWKGQSLRLPGLSHFAPDGRDS
jgi:ABC-type antimicrobial peptide transport system permease subunit